MLRSRLLASAAGIMIAFAFVAAPAFGQSTTESNRSDNNGYTDGTNSDILPAYRPKNSGTQHSTQDERARTKELNQRQRNGTYALPATLNGQMPGGLKQADETNEERSRAYRDRLSHYHKQMDRYREQRSNYEHNMARFDQRKWRFRTYPNDIHYSYEVDSLRRVALMTRSRVLIGLPVQGPNGWVGRVRNEHVDTSGRIGRVEIALNHRFAVWVPADHLRFDRHRSVVFTDLSKQDVWGMTGSYVQAVESH
ncbi:MAG: hypothetical protein ACP5QR_09425 [Rhizomicrobium sp.]